MIDLEQLLAYRDACAKEIVDLLNGDPWHNTNETEGLRAYAKIAVKTAEHRLLTDILAGKKPGNVKSHNAVSNCLADLVCYHKSDKRREVTLPDGRVVPALKTYSPAEIRVAFKTGASSGPAGNFETV